MTWQRSFFNLSSPARNAATRRRKLCRPTLASGSTSARTVRLCCVPRQATVACSAPTGRRSVRRSRRMAWHAARAERRTGCLRQRVPPSSRHSANAISGAERGVMPRRWRIAPGFFVMSTPSNRMRPLAGLGQRGNQLRAMQATLKPPVVSTRFWPSRANERFRLVAENLPFTGSMRQQLRVRWEGQAEWRQKVPRVRTGTLGGRSWRFPTRCSCRSAGSGCR